MPLWKGPLDWRGNTDNGQGLRGGLAAPPVIPSYDPDAQLLFDANTTKPDSTRRGLFDTFYKAIKAGGAWSPLDMIHFHAGHAEQGCRLNLKDPSKYTLTPVNAPAFTVDRGYQGDGVGAYLGTGYFFTGANQFSQDNATIIAYANSAPADNSNSTAIIGMDVTSGTLNFLRNRDTPGGMGGRVNATTNDNSVAVASRFGLKGLVRASATQIQFYNDGAPLGGALTRASAAMQNKELLHLRLGTLYSADRVAFGAAGAALVDSQMMALRNAVVSFLTSIGAQ